MPNMSSIVEKGMLLWRAAARITRRYIKAMVSNIRNGWQVTVSWLASNQPGRPHQVMAETNVALQRALQKLDMAYAEMLDHHTKVWQEITHLDRLRRQRSNDLALIGDYLTTLDQYRETLRELHDHAIR